MKKIAEILETTISHSANGTVVQLHLADAPKDDPHASFRLQLLATLPTYQAPLLIHLQREALTQAREMVAAQLEALLKDIPPGGASAPAMKK